jgi:hypothetical protein
MLSLLARARGSKGRKGTFVILSSLPLCIFVCLHSAFDSNSLRTNAFGAHEADKAKRKISRTYERRIEAANDVDVESATLIDKG